MPQPHEPPAQPGFLERLQNTANGFAFAASVFTTFAEVALFRTDFGERYFQCWKTGVVVPLLLLFPLFWPGEDPTPLLLCLVLYVLMCMLHRIDIYRRRRRGGPRIHSLYNGKSRLEKSWPNVSEDLLKSKYEPFLLSAIGVAALVFSPPLGWFFIWCAGAMMVHAGLLNASQRQRALDLTDAQIEGQVLAGMAQEQTRINPLHEAEVVSVHGSNR